MGMKIHIYVLICIHLDVALYLYIHMVACVCTHACIGVYMDASTDYMYNYICPSQACRVS